MFGMYFDKMNSTPNPDYEEILKLDRMLTNAGIPHTCERIFDGWKVCYPSKNDDEIVMDAIEHYASYGQDDDKLEIMGLLTPEEEEIDSVLGHLSADEVFARIWFHFNAQWEYFCNLNKTPEVEEEKKTETPILTPEEFEEKMLLIKKRLYDESGDNEVCHMKMDGEMCALLSSLGYGKGIDVFENTDKWYA